MRNDPDIPSSPKNRGPWFFFALHHSFHLKLDKYILHICWRINRGGLPIGSGIHKLMFWTKPQQWNWLSIQCPLSFENFIDTKKNNMQKYSSRTNSCSFCTLDFQGGVPGVLLKENTGGNFMMQRGAAYREGYYNQTKDIADVREALFLFRENTVFNEKYLHTDTQRNTTWKHAIVIFSKSANFRCRELKQPNLA